ncbi:MAG: hypothetical protein IJ011_09675 [Clostridia bacterium]|nr:hypothetical protein [Clostridia bacterium]
MLERTENNVCRSDTPAKERIFSGRCLRRGAPVVGRLVFETAMGSFAGNEALLAVIEDNERCSLSDDDGRTVGVVRISEHVGAHEHDVSCPSIALSELPRECGGRIALLDTDAGKLYVSPNIVTVNKYTPLLRSCRPSVHERPLILPCGRRINISAIPEARFLLTDTADGYIIRPSPAIGDEEALYSKYRDIAESAVGHKVTFTLSARKDMQTELRALMRAAVWGEVSLLFCNVLTEKELVGAFGNFCNAFCELEGDGREFNGYLPRGLRIDSPHLLRFAADLRGADFFVYDVERMAELMSGRKQNIPEELILRLCEDIMKIKEERKDIKHSVILYKNTLSPSLLRALIDGRISEYATRQNSVSELRSGLAKALTRL